MKRFLDIFCSFFGLIVFLPILLPTMFLIWLQDFNSPFFKAPRLGINGKVFTMVKLRSMVLNADKSGVDSTQANDVRITKIGKFIRKFKLDELTQLWNVLIGDVSLVGPRPNVIREVEIYTEKEKRLLSVKPGITDFSSIVFSDEADILEGHPDPDIGYNQLIRPWKSRLAFVSIDNQSIILDLKIIWLTAGAIISKEKALFGVVRELKKIKVPEDLIKIAARKEKLIPTPPLGANKIITKRDFY